MTCRALPTLAAACLVLALTGAVAWAQDVVRVRGTISSVNGDTIEVNSREGTALKIKIAPNPSVSAIINASLSDIKAGSYIGIAGTPQPDGSQRALEVHIFPESMRGLAEGFRPWDLLPQSTMTNATVESIVAAVDGHKVVLKYKGGDQTILIPEGVPIVAFAPGEASEIKPGTAIFIAGASKQPDGTLQAQRVTVGRGVTPPL